MASIVYDRSQSLPNFTATKEDYRSLNNSTNTPDDFECLKVEIVESDNSMAHPTTVSLIRCKKQIIHPFRKILCLISWRPFGADSYRRSSIPFRILNIIYPLFIFVLLLFNYIYEILVCQGSLSTVIVPVTTSAPMYSTTPGPNTTNMSLYLPSQRIQQRNETECGHVFTVYMIPDILHCAAFIIGFLYFRITEGEPMYSLIEKVFINADRNIRLFSPNRVIRRLKIFLLIGCIWVLASVTVHALSVVISDFNHHGVFENHNDSDSMGYSLFIVDIICLLVKNCIHLAVVMNFVSHCELIVFYCKAIRTRLEEKSVQLLEAMKQILDLKSSITQLNSAVSRMMSLLIVYFIDRLIVGLVILVRDDYTQTLTIIYRVLYPLIWLPILMFSIGMAARVTSKCDKFQQITHSMRVYGYHTATPSELDGFLLFVSVAELRVKLFGLAVRPGIVISTVVTTLLVCVVLIQTDIIDNKYVSI